MAAANQACIERLILLLCDNLQTTPDKYDLFGSEIVIFIWLTIVFYDFSKSTDRGEQERIGDLKKNFSNIVIKCN